MTTNYLIRKRSRKNRIGAAAKIILPYIATAGSLTILAVAPGAAPGLLALFKHIDKFKEKRIQRELDNLVKQDYLRRHPHKSGDTYEIAARGRLVLRTHKAFISEKSIIVPHPSKWDGIWRIIIFDIPEHERQQRAQLRKMIMAFGFKYLQQSVWLYPYPCDDYIQTLKDNLDIRDKLIYIQARYIEGDAKLRRQFHLI